MEGEKMEAILKAEEGGRKVEIFLDESAESPREWDNLGTIVAWHRNYDLGDNHDFPTPESFDEEINDDNAFILPVYMYDHSGITIRTRPFDCPWDSGQLGWIYVLKAKVREEYKVKRISPRRRQKVLDMLRSEIDIYDRYLGGEAYGYVASENGEVVDSCWGFIGADKEGMRHYIPEDFRKIFDDLDW